MVKRAAIPDWETLLAHAAILQTKIPGAILVGGTAAAIHARHRFSVDHDHVVKNLSKVYDEAILALESIVGWRTHRKIRGKLVLGAKNNIAAGLRNQRRSAPLETTEFLVRGGGRLKIPTVEEMLRIKAFLVVDRNATRDYLDVAALSHQCGLLASSAALKNMDELYVEFAGEGGSMLTSLVVRLSVPEPYDLTEVDLSEYKGIIAPWNSWSAVVSQCGDLAEAIITQ